MSSPILDLYMRIAEHGVTSLLLALCLGMPCSSAEDRTAAKAACRDPVHRQFDFWLGDWDVFDAEGPKSAHVLVESILDGCVLQETYEGANGANGKSFTIYDASRNRWHQSWVTNRGQLLEIEGTFEAGSIKLSGVDRAPGGKERLVQGTWQPVPGGVREFASTSIDHGKTWTPWFDIVFRPHAP
jgi:hypothetical protein